jgi:hypothetical protein
MENLKDYLPPWMRSKWINPNLRLAFAEVLNPVYNMPGMPEKYQQAERLGLFDAGLIFNLPFPALNPYGDLRQSRNADIVIFIDASDDNYSDTHVRSTTLRNLDSWPDGTTLRQVEKYAGVNGMPFPGMPRAGEPNAPGCNVFNVYDEERKPLVIYYPVAIASELFTRNGQEIVQNALDDSRADISVAELGDMQEHFKDHYKTAHTDLQVREAQMLMTFMEYNALYSMPTVLPAIKRRIVGVGYQATMTEQKVDMWLRLMRGARTVESLSLQECNDIVKAKYPTQRLFANEKDAKLFIRTRLGQALEHSTAN